MGTAEEMLAGKVKEWVPLASEHDQVVYIAMHSKSPAAYRLMQGSKFIILPHETTLRHHAGFTTAGSGFNPAVMEQLKKDIQFDQLPDFKKNVVLLFDEMRIKSGLVYDHATGNIVGFTDMGDINNKIEQFVDSCKRSEEGDGEPEVEVATHVLAFMVRGIFVPLHVVFGHAPCTGFKAKYLYPALQNAINILEVQGFNVRALCSDGASPNRKVYRILAGDNVHFTINRWSPEKRKIYLICDPPHLIKTTRNNWENSHWNSKTRFLKVSKIIFNLDIFIYRFPPLYIAEYIFIKYRLYIAVDKGNVTVGYM